MATPSARKPANIAYSVDESPPHTVTALTVFQQFGLMSINLIYPVLIGREVGGAPRLVGDLMSLSFVVLGVGALLHALPRGPVGSGFLCQPVPSAVYLVPSLLAARRGDGALEWPLHRQAPRLHADSVVREIDA